MEELLNNDGPGGIWLRHPMEHRIVLLCSRTGLRAGELLGLQLDQITKDAEGYWMQVENSWDRVELTDTKTHETRLVPVALELGERVFGGCPNKGFVFSEDNGKSPINYRRIQTHLNNALRGMGIDDATRKRRGVTLHSLRHKVNTDLRGLVPDSVVRAVIGHVTEEMTDHYTRHSKETLEQVAKVMRGEAS
jgi:integrase